MSVMNSQDQALFYIKMPGNTVLGFFSKNVFSEK